MRISLPPTYFEHQEGLWAFCILGLAIRYDFYWVSRTRRLIFSGFGRYWMWEKMPNQRGITEYGHVDSLLV